MQKRGVVAFVHQTRNGFGDGAHALGALRLCAEFVVIDHIGQAFGADRQGFFAVLVEEKFGVCQTGANHAFVAANDCAGVVRRDVADHQKLVAQLTLRVEQRKVFLVGLHGENQTLGRNVQELFLERAAKHIGALNQGGDFV